MVTTLIVHTGPPLTVNVTVTVTVTEIGTGTAIAMGIRLAAAGDTTGPTRTTSADTPLPRVAKLEVQKDTDPVVTAMPHVNENALRDTETTITATDLPPIDTDHPVGGMAMKVMKIRKSVGDVDARGGIAKRIGIAMGRNTMVRQRNPRALTTRRWRVKTATEVTLEESSTTLQVYTIANIDLGMTPMRCPFRIIL